MGIRSSGGGVAPGNIDYFAANTPPAGWIKANGAAISRAVYAALFAVIGTTWGVGDGSTTFNVPDGRGEFPRGWDDARGVDSGRAFASAQAQDTQPHAHGQVGYTAGGGSTGPVNMAGYTSPAGSGLATASFGTTENRPRNLAWLCCIKY
jgi:microcystin-dependent protein